MSYIGNSPALKYTTFAVQHFTTSATTGYTLDNAVTNENDIRLVINNVVQQPGGSYAYTAAGTVLTLSAATTTSDTMYCVFLGKAVQTVNPGAGSVGTSQLATDAVTQAKMADDSVGTAEILDTNVTGAKLNDDAISGQGALGATPADTDEFLVSDAGVLKRVDYSYLKGGNNTPSFAATRNSTQALSHDAITKIQYDVELFDSDGCYDTSNYRFTPATAGKYLIIHQACVNKGVDSTINTMSSYIYKNGSSYGYSQINFAANPVRAANLTHQAIITMDADDYVEPYAYVSVSGGVNLQSTTAAPLSIFQGFKIIGA